MASAVIFPAAERHCPLIGTKLHCLVTEADVCEQLAEGRYMKAKWLGVDHNSNTLAITPRAGFRGSRGDMARSLHQ